MEDEDPASKKALSSFHGTVVNQIKCHVCGTVSSNKEGFYDLAVPLPVAGKVFSLNSCQVNFKFLGAEIAIDEYLSHLHAR